MQQIKIVYLVILCALILVMGSGLVYSPNSEKSCDSTPKIEKDSIYNIKEKTLQFEDKLKYKINLRNSLIQWNSKLKYRLFKSSINTNQAVIGKNDWVYYSNKSDKIVDSYTHQNNYTEEELSEFITALEQRHQMLNNKGIQFCQAVWPNKSTIYPEHMPARYRNQKKDQPSRMSEFYEAMQESEVPLVDMRETFRTIKDTSLIYLKHDTHWNDLGAYYAYSALMKQLGIEPYPLSDFKLTWKSRAKGDLLSLIGLCNATTITEMEPILEYKGDKSVEIIERQGETGPLYRCVNAEQNKTLLMFRDSFGSALRPYLSLHFRASYYPWKKYNPGMVNRIKPDIVICASVERYL